MQSINKEDEVVQTVFLDERKPAEIIEHLKSAKEKGAVKHQIGEMLKKGQIVEVDGLRYEVGFVDYKRGKVWMKLLQ